MALGLKEDGEMERDALRPAGGGGGAPCQTEVFALEYQKRGQAWILRNQRLRLR